MSFAESGDLVSLEGIRVEFHTRTPGRRRLVAVDDVSFVIPRGVTVGLVGESGSGKLTIGRVILGLQPPAAGRVLFKGNDVTSRSVRTQRELARAISAVFQDPFGSLNPAMTVGRSIVEPATVQSGYSSDRARGEAQRLLVAVQLPGNVAGRYPSSFSGGQRQRIAIARSLSTSPELIVCDEAVSALDVVTRAQILELLAGVQRDLGLALLFISHDLPVVRRLAREVVVLYRGRVMEKGSAAGIIESPLHPYTRALIAAVPVVDPEAQRRRRALRRAAASPASTAPAPLGEDACVFAGRCPEARAVCWELRPREVLHDGRSVFCHLYDPASGYGDSASAASVESPASASAGSAPASSGG